MDLAMKFRLLLPIASAATLFGAASAHADSPSPPATAAPAATTSASGTKGTLYGDLPIGTLSDDYVNAQPPSKIAPLPSHLVVKNGSQLTDRSNAEGFNPRTPLMSCISDNGQLQATHSVSSDGGGNRGLRSVRLLEAGDGASLVTDSILLRDGMPVGAFHHGSLPLRKVQTLVGGLVVYGARDERESHRFVHFVVKPPQSSDARMLNMIHATVFSTDGRFHSSNGCGFILVSLPIAKDAASTAIVRMNTIISATDVEQPQFEGEIRIPARAQSQREFVLRPLALAFSASQLGGDTEPRVSTSAAWKGDETTQRIFLPMAQKR